MIRGGVERQSLLVSGHHVVAVLLFVLCAVGSSLDAVEHVRFERDGTPHAVSGRVLAEAADGGILLQDAAGRMWPLQPEQIRSRDRDAQVFEPYDPQQVAALLREEFPDLFAIHTTQNYVICYNTSAAYARWCGGLLERLHRAFTNFWRNKRFAVRAPQFPLVAVVLADQESYRRYAQTELGDAAASVVGYYSLETNRVTMYDLTGAAGLRGVIKTRNSAEAINRVLSQPRAVATVATIVHEATHQIAYNCGLQVRFADCPLWLSEGLAIYFESPDLRSRSGWRGIGTLNRNRWEAFRRGGARRSQGWLPSLVADDAPFRNTHTAADRYAESWAVVYYLIRRRPQDMVRYLEMTAAKNQLVWDRPARRLEEFRTYFGDDLTALEGEVEKVMEKLAK